jgi:hypothetical protein
MKVTKHFFVSYNYSTPISHGCGNTIFTCETDDDPPTQPELPLARVAKTIEQSVAGMKNPKVVIMSFQEVSESQAKEFQSKITPLS